MKEKEVRKYLENLDLDFVKDRLRKNKKSGGLSWNKNKTENIEMQYKAFLFVCWKYSKETQIPTVDIDEFWHMHILFTKKYHKMCYDIYGYYLHHTPLEIK